MQFAAITIITSFYGHQLDMTTMRKRYSTNLNSMNLKKLIEIVDSLGLVSRTLQCLIDEVPKLATPYILHWSLNHFVVLTKASGTKAIGPMSINSPVTGKRTLTAKEFSKHLTAFGL